MNDTKKISTNFDSVNRPSHYCEGRKYEPIDVISDWGLNFSLGNVVKYISRAGRKKSNGLTDMEKELQDLEKAQFYLNYHINTIKETLDKAD